MSAANERRQLGVDHRVAAVLHDDRTTGEALEPRQSADQVCAFSIASARERLMSGTPS
jgi:hypothetical protein